MIAGWLRWADRCDEVWLLPTFHHAFGKPLRPFADRVAACERLAALVGPHVRVCDIERTLPTPSFTIVTLDTLAAAHPEHQLQLVVGADILKEAAKWREWPRIATEYRPIVVGRGGAAVPDAPGFPDVSSSEVRARLEAGEAVDHLVPASVLACWLGKADVA
jgi:nicotinate-nucleotide adenylyltransferase